MSERRMFHDDLFGEENGSPYLIAKKCNVCGNIQFPQKGFCQKCLNEKMDDVHVGTTGILYSYTTTYGRVDKRKGPFDVGYVMIPEGLRIFTPLSRKEGQEYEIGQEVELEIIDLWEEEDVISTGYGYKVKEISE